jgi:hypothetical protein
MVDEETKPEETENSAGEGEAAVEEKAEEIEEAGK